MSEKLTHPEQHKINPAAETASSGEHLKHHPESAPARHEHQDNIEDIQRSIEHHAKKSHEHRQNNSPEASHRPSETFVTKELKVMAFERTMHRIRRNLSPVDKSMSKFIHNQTIDKASQLAGQTIARPSAILGAGLLSAIGGGIYFLISKHFGYDYNPTVLFILFLTGFGIGLLIELIRKIGSREI